MPIIISPNSSNLSVNSDGETSLVKLSETELSYVSVATIPGASGVDGRTLLSGVVNPTSEGAV